MANRGLADDEIAVIKGMLAAGMPAQDICGYMFRPDRSLNPAGVYEIKAGKRGKDIVPLSAEALEAWLKAHPYFGTIATADRISELRKELRGILRPLREGARALVAPTEATRLEFKETFHPKSFTEYCRSLIGYANHCGGFIVFGITNDKEIVGLKGTAFKEFDPKNLSEIIKETVSPSIRWHCFQMSVLDREIGVFYSEESETKPLITLRNFGNVKAHTVYFRYEGETAQARAGDLQTMIREREQQAVQSAIAKLQQISGIGLNEADITYRGAPVDVAPPDASSTEPSTSSPPQMITILKKSSLTDLDILLEFINGEVPDDPLGYIKQSAHEPVRWLPIFFFSQNTGLSPPSLCEQVRSSPSAKPATVNHMISRINGKISAYKGNLGKSPRYYLSEIESGNIPNASDMRTSRHISQALVALGDNSKMSIVTMRAALGAIFSDYHKYNKDPVIGSYMRRSAARADEVFFRPKR